MIRVGVDIGGTFTDFVIFNESEGKYSSYKILSTPSNPEEAVLTGLSQIPENEPHAVIHGSTVATNTVLERKGARTALLTTRGFRDMLSIGRQTRTDLYRFDTSRPAPIIPPEACFEITERVDCHGEVLTPLVEAELPALIQELRSQEIESVAISLLFSFLYPKHESWLAQSLRDAGFFVSPSSEVLPEFREYERTSTTAINAYVSPVMDRYIGRLEQDIQATDFRIMQSNGGSIQADRARREAVRSILSGPAGGAVGAQYVAQAAGFDNIITFDMGGTSSDVSLSRGEVQVTSEAQIGGLPIRVPVIDIHTVGSGGGSIAYVDIGGALRVGPESAGADPGPVCYGRGGIRPTVTDANLLLGRLSPERFLGGQMALDVDAATHALTKLGEQADLQPVNNLTLAQTAALGVIQVVNAHMERALRVISVERGYDTRDFALVSFGGAGGLHSCDLARSLGIKHVLIPPSASTLSAFGMLTADVVKDYVKTVMLPSDAPRAELQSHLQPLLTQGHAEILAEDIPADRVVLHSELDMRYRGQSFELTIPFVDDFMDEFHAAHHLAYNYSHPTAAVEIVNVRVRAVGQVTRPPLQEFETGETSPEKALSGYQPVVLTTKENPQGTIVDLPFYAGPDLHPGHTIAGPTIIVQNDTTVFLPDGETATVDMYNNLVIENHG